MHGESLEVRSLLSAFYVNGDVGDDANPGTDDAPFRTIWAGVDAALRAPGDDEVVLQPLPEGQTYAEPIAVVEGASSQQIRGFEVFDGDLILRGSTGQSEDIVVGGFTENAAGLFVDAPIDVTIADLTIDGSTHAGIIHRSAHSVTVDNVVISNSGGGALAGILHQNGTLAVTDSELSANQYGIFSLHIENVSTPVALTVSDTRATNNARFGIIACNVTGTVSLTNFRGDGNQLAGLFIEDAGGLNINGGTFDRNGKDGIYINDVVGATIANISASNNGSPEQAAAHGLLAIKAPDLTILDSTFSGNRNRGLLLGDADGVTLDRLTVANNGQLEGSGGGIRILPVSSAPITISNSEVRENRSQGGRAGIEIWATESPVVADTTIINSVIANNQVVAAAEVPERRAGAVSVTGYSHLTLINSNVTGNTSPHTAGVFMDTWGSIDGVLPEMNIIDSVVADNTATADNSTGGVFQWGGVMSISGSTISGNAADRTGGVYSRSVSGEIVNSTISGNIGKYTAGIEVDPRNHFLIAGSTVRGNRGVTTGGIHSCTDRVSIANSIVAQNYIVDELGRSAPNDFAGPVASLGNNLFGFAGDDFPLKPTDLSGTQNNPLQAMLGPLQDNGGFAPTHLPLQGSPAIDAGDSELTSQPLTDQRGEARIQRGQMDIGAVEIINQSPTVTVNELNVSGDEGSVVRNQGNYFEPDADTVTITASIGSVVTFPDGTWQWTHTPEDGPDSRSVTITVSDSFGASQQVSFDVLAQNVVPVTSVSGPADSQPGQQIQLELSASDVSVVDLASQFLWQVDWNSDGVIDDEFHGDNSAAITHVFESEGQYAIRIRAIDKDGGVSEFVTHDLTVVDNGEAGFEVSHQAVSVTEAGAQASFSVVLSQRPSTDVVFDVAGDDETEAAADLSSLTFTSANWDVPQFVTVTGVDDVVVDGTQLSSVVVGVDASRSDSAFASLTGHVVVVSTTDDDAAGFAVGETEIAVSENQTSATFGVVLTSAPLTDVVFRVSGDDDTEATVDLSSLTFTPLNWDVAQLVTVTGVDDSVVDGTQRSEVLVGVDASLSDAAFASLADQVVAVTTVDNDAAGFIVGESEIVVSENQTSSTFSVVLSSAPLTDVVFRISGNDATEATIDLSSLTFTLSNWDVAQFVTVTGVDDFVVDGNQLSEVLVGVNASLSDAAFASLSDQVVAVTTVDNDAADFIVGETEIVVSENQTSSTFSVVLTSAPLTDVVFSVSGDDPTEATVDLSSLRFTPSNWDVAQAVTVTGVDDFVVDGDQVSRVFVSIDELNSDDSFASLSDKVVQVTTTDDDVAEIDILFLDDSVSESHDADATGFVVSRNSDPTEALVVSLANNEPGKMVVPLEVTIPAGEVSVYFNEVTVVDDLLASGDLVVTVTASAAGHTFGVDSIVVTDNDVPTIELLDVPEYGFEGQDFRLTVVRNTPVTEELVVTLFSSDQTEVSLPATITIPVGQSESAPFILSMLHDGFVDGDQDLMVAAIATGYVSESASLTVQDADTAGIGLVLPERMSVSESGTSVAATVQLETRPVSTVVLRLSSDDVGEAIVSPITLTFESDNWNTPQEFVITGVDDPIADGTQFTEFQIFVVNEDSDIHYHDLLQEFMVATTDDETPGFQLRAEQQLVVSEIGDSKDFAVVLDAAPSEPVILYVDSSDLSEVAVFPEALAFTADNWQIPQTVTITGVDDFEFDGNQQSTVTVSDRKSASQTLDVINLDNDYVPSGNVDGDADFDANDSFLIHLIRLSGTNAQVDQSKGSSVATADEFRTTVDQLALIADVDGDSDFDANDSFLVHLVKLAGTDAQVDQSKGGSTLSASEIRANVNALEHPSTSAARFITQPAPVPQAVYAISDTSQTIFDSADIERLPFVSIANNVELPSAELSDIWNEFRSWIDSV